MAKLPRWRGGPLLGRLLGNQTRDFVAVFFIGTPRSSELGSATNEKTQAVGPGFGFLVDILERRSNENLFDSIDLDN